MERLSTTDLYDKLADLWAENPKSQERFSTWYRELCDVSDMLGKTITNITLPNENQYQDMILFECSDGSAYLMYHEQNCCESVEIEDIAGDLDILIGHPLTVADVSTKAGEEDDWGTSTWTFYHFATIKGYVDIRWYGASNGYYSEEVDFVKLK